MRRGAPRARQHKLFLALLLLFGVDAGSDAPVQARSDGLFATVQVAQLPNGRLTIPPNKTLAIEIGTSDRNTLDTELLPGRRDWFLVSLEPLSDKYARGLARNPKWQGDTFQPLGHHHERGLILPLAVGDVPTEGGATLTFHVGANAGCSSLLPINNGSNRLKWCKQVAETRRVPTVSLEAVLGWAVQHVEKKHDMSHCFIRHPTDRVADVGSATARRAAASGVHSGLASACSFHTRGAVNLALGAASTPPLARATAAHSVHIPRRPDHRPTLD